MISMLDIHGAMCDHLYLGIEDTDGWCLVIIYINGRYEYINLEETISFF